ncbi:MAG: MalT-like region [Acidobacteriota bacterium]|jgi:tetratricopeptide (TPR) repeat protein|nr:MalT-like region [Acidobacteriota bacterium]
MDENSVEDEGAGSNFLDCAVEIASTIDNLESRSEVISLIAVRYAESGLLDNAVDLAETINDSFMRDQALASLAARGIEVGEDDYAGKLLEMIEDDNLHSDAMGQMAIKYAEAGAVEKSIELAWELDDSAPTLSQIALVCAGSGHFAQALEVARSIEYADSRAVTLAELAAKALQDGRSAEALELLPEAMKAADEIEFSEQRISTLIEIAYLYKESGQEEQAFEILSRAHHLCNKFDGSTPAGMSTTYAKDGALAQIAGRFAALQRYDQADSIVEEIEDPFQFARATIMVALEYHRAGRSTEALAWLTQALEIVRDEEVYGEHGLMQRESLVDSLALSYATAGHYEEALQVTEMLNSQDQRQRTLAEMAKLCARSGNNSRVFEVSEMIKYSYARVLCDVGVADAFVESEQLELADHTLSQALLSAATIELPYEKALALMEIAPRIARREQTAKASNILFEALTTVALIDGSYHRSLTLINLAGKYTEVGLEAGEREQQVLQEMILKLE